MNKIVSLAAIPLIAALAGCRRDDITTYSIPKEAVTAAPMAMPTASMAAPMGSPADSGMTMTPEGTQHDIHWDVPKGWVAQPLSVMRVGSFLIKGENGQTADVSVVPLAGEAGGDLANVNRWRGQINLSPITESDLPRYSESLQVQGIGVRVVDFVSTENLIDGKFKKRLIAATLSTQGRSWFFKMIGDAATVAAAKPAFLRFLRSARLRGAPAS